MEMFSTEPAHAEAVGVFPAGEFAFFPAHGSIPADEIMEE